MLKLEAISSGYGKRQVLFDISLDIAQGEIVLLAGSNGSGKSTLLKVIYRLLPLFGKRGTIIFDKKDIVRIDSDKLVRRGLIYVPQKNNTFEHLTVKENLEIAATHSQNNLQLKHRISKLFDLMPELAALQTCKPFHLSGGERQQLAFGMAHILSPKMILLDEPGAGLSPNTFQKCLDLIKKMNDEGITFIIAEHRIKECVLIANRIICLKNGTLLNSVDINSTFKIETLIPIFN